MFSVLVNTLTVLVGGTLGCLFSKRFSRRIADAMMLALGVCTLYIGISGMFEGNDPLVLILCSTLGVALGTLLDLDGRIHRLGEWVEGRFRKKKKEGGPSLAEGMVSGSLLFCVGAMTIVGSLNAGFGDHTMLLTKSMLDFVSSMMLATTLGVGILLSSLTVFTVQGGIALLASFLVPYLTEVMIGELTAVGSLIVALIGLQMMGVLKVKVADFLPAILLVPPISYLLSLLPTLIG